MGGEMSNTSKSTGSSCCYMPILVSPDLGNVRNPPLAEV